MKTRTKLVATTLALTLVLMVLHPAGPLGHLLWPQAPPDAPQPEAWQMPLLVGLAIVEAAASAFGVGLLLFGRDATRGILPDDPRMGTALHLSLSYLLIQWWPHGNLHISVPFSFGSIIAIDYAFHVPIVIAIGVIVAAIARAAHRARATGRDAPTRRPLAEAEPEPARQA